MLLNIQFEEASGLLWEMYKAIPVDERGRFSARVDRISSKLCHPDLGGSVVCSIRCDDTIEPTIRTSRGVISPLEGAKITY